MKQQHTPGPWEYEHFDGESFELKTTQPGEYEPIITGCGCCGSPRLSKDADGKLIAAAPELLEALKLARGEVQYMASGMTHSAWKTKQAQDALAIIDAAIAKSTGQA